jgi:hypothetical protein
VAILPEIFACGSERLFGFQKNFTAAADVLRRFVDIPRATARSLAAYA